MSKSYKTLQTSYAGAWSLARRRVRRAVAVLAHPGVVAGALVIGRHPVCHVAGARPVSGAYLVVRSQWTLEEEINVCAVGFVERQTDSSG